MSRRLSALATAAVLGPLVLAPPASADHLQARDVTAFACPAGETPRGAFDDVDEQTPLALEIDCAAVLGLVRGELDGRYAAARTVTRAEAAVLVGRLYAYVVPEFTSLTTSPTSFTDLGGLPAEAVAAVELLASAGVVLGTSETTYSPGGPVTREQAALLLHRVRLLVGADPVPGASFDDTGDLQEESQVAIEQLAQAAITAGSGPDRTYSPRRVVTRGELAALLVRLSDDALERTAGPGNLGRFTTPAQSRVVAQEPSTSDDVTYVFNRVRPGAELRLVLSDRVDRRGTFGSQTVVASQADPESSTGSSAVLGDPPAAVVSVNGVAVTASRDLLVRPVGGRITFVVDPSGANGNVTPLLLDPTGAEGDLPGGLPRLPTTGNGEGESQFTTYVAPGFSVSFTTP